MKQPLLMYQICLDLKLLEIHQTCPIDKLLLASTLFNPDYAIGFLRPDSSQGLSLSRFTGSGVITRKSDYLEIES